MVVDWILDLGSLEFGSLELIKPHFYSESFPIHFVIGDSGK
jgi:hypothetical protein